MKRFVCLLLIVVGLFTATNSFGSETLSDLETLTIGDFVYQVPSGWISTGIQENGFRYHYAKEERSTDGGYIAVQYREYDREIELGMTLDTLYDGIIDGMKSAEEHISELTNKSILINGMSGRMFTRECVLHDINYKNPFVLLYVKGHLLIYSFINSEYSQTQAEDLVNQLTSQIWLLQPFSGSQVMADEESTDSAVLSSGWQNAMQTDLQEAQLKIAERISQLKAASYDATEAIVLTGSGTSIQTGIEVNFSPSRVTLEGTGEAKLTGGKYDFRMDSRSGKMSALMDETGSLTALIESTGDWTLTIEPIKPGASLPMTGSGPFVSDFFELTAPMIVTIKATGGQSLARSSNVIIALVHQYKNISNWDDTNLTNEIIRRGDTVEKDVIIQPIQGRNEYAFEIYVQPGVEWSITPKQ